MIQLLDANVLIALSIAEHDHHQRVSEWLSTVDRIAVCPIVQGSLVRFLVRVGESAGAAIEVLRQLDADPRCEFWPDAVSYADADLRRVRGHRQVTDAYLVALVAAHGNGRLATLDEGLAREHTELTFLIPEHGSPVSS